MEKRHEQVFHIEYKDGRQAPEKMFNIIGFFIHHSPKLEPNQMFFNRWMVKATVVYNTMEYHSAINRTNYRYITCNDLYELPENYGEIKVKKSQSQKVALCMIPFYSFPEMTKLVWIAD